MSSTDKNQQVRLHELLVQKLGMDWRKNIPLTIRADSLYWFVHLIEHGIKARRAELKADPHTSPAEVAASIGSWTIDLEHLVDQIEASLEEPVEANPRRRRKGR